MSAAVSNRPFERVRNENLTGAPSTKRWAICCAAIVALHVIAVLIAIRMHAGAQLVTPPAPPPILIDLPPLPAQRAEPPRPKPAPPQHQVAKPQPPEPVVQATLPPAPRSPAHHVYVAVPQRAQTKPVQRIAQAQPVPDIKPPEAVASAAPLAAAPPVPAAAVPATAPAQPAAASNPNAVPTWQGTLIGRLQRFKRYPSSAQFKHQQGVVYLRFSMDRRGKVLASSIEKSSGVDALDQETLALIHRAEPLPAPPPEMAGDPVELVVPVEFSLKP